MTPQAPQAPEAAPPISPDQPIPAAPRMMQTQRQPRVRKADARQITLSYNEMKRLAVRVRQDFYGAQSDHDRRMARFQRYYRRWRGLTDMPMLGEEDAPNFNVPVTKWQVFSKWSKQNGALFGADAEITAKPIGPDDQRRVKKIARFMTWRCFDSMRIANPATIFNFRQILFGRSHALVPWKRETYMVPMDDGSEQERVSYDGPDFLPIWPDDIVVPAEDARSIHDFSFVILKDRKTPDELLLGEAKEQYQGIQDNFDRIFNASNDRRQRDFYNERIKIEKDAAEGVTYEGNLSGANSLIVYNWYGRWRMLKGRQDGAETNLERREMYETELLVKYLPDLDLVIGIQKLSEMYPTQKNRRPIVEASLVEDGSYWSPGFGELLEDIEQELSVNHNRLEESGQLSVGPVIFYKPGQGFDPETFRYSPGMAIATDDPNTIKVVQTQTDLNFSLSNEQRMVSYAERVTGITDMNIGRASDRPNAPRTARGTLALLEEGDVRATLDLSVLREHWGRILTHLWELEGMYGSPRTFFRVTEEDAGGAFDVGNGGAYLSEQERSGQYDFDLKFATNAYSKETQKQNQLALYQLDLNNPLVVNNPRALWLTLDKVHRAFGDDRFADVIPQPPDPGLPVDPTVEWTRCLEGEDIFVHPMDNDELHILQHNKRLASEAGAQDPNTDAYNAMVSHVQDHIRAMQQKKMLAAMTAALSQQLHGAMSPGFSHLSALHSAAMAAQQSQMQAQPQGAQSLDGGGDGGSNEAQPS